MQVIAFVKAETVISNGFPENRIEGYPTAGATSIPPVQGPASVLPRKTAAMQRASKLSPHAAEYHPPSAGRDDSIQASPTGPAPPADAFARTEGEELLNSQLPKPWPRGQGPDQRKGARHFSDVRTLPLSIPEARRLLQEALGKNAGHPEYRCDRTRARTHPPRLPATRAVRALTPHKRARHSATQPHVAHTRGHVIQASSHDKAILKTHTRARSRLSLDSLAPKVLANLTGHTRALSASASNLS